MENCICTIGFNKLNFHTDCLSLFILLQRLKNNDIDFQSHYGTYNFVNNGNLLEKEKQIINDSYEIKKYESKYYKIKHEINDFDEENNHIFNIIDDIFFEIMHSNSTKSSEIFRYMLNRNMIKKRKLNFQDLTNYDNDTECKIRIECIGHKSSTKTGRCGGDICNDCNKYIGRCMTDFQHCCCYVLNLKIE